MGHAAAAGRRQGALRLRFGGDGWDFQLLLAQPMSLPVSCVTFRSASSTFCQNVPRCDGHISSFLVMLTCVGKLDAALAAAGSPPKLVDLATAKLQSKRNADYFNSPPLPPILSTLPIMMCVALYYRPSAPGCSSAFISFVPDRAGTWPGSFLQTSC